MRRLVDEGLWELIESLLPPEPDKSRGGRPPRTRQGRARRDRVRFEEWHTLANDARRARMQRRDLLETPERLAGSGGVARVAPPAAGEVETSWPAGLV